MSSSHSRSPRARRASLSAKQLGVNASCLLLTILTANHAAARPDTSLPYLAQTAPESLRFDVRRELGPPPSRPGAIIAEATLAQTSAPSTDASPAAQTTSTTITADTIPSSPGIPSSPALPSAPAQPALPATISSPDIYLVPDIYSPFAPPVTIDDLLFFFVPPRPNPAPPSRATYELK